MYNVNLNHSSSTSQNNPNFGMALSMNKKRIGEHLGSNAARAVERIEPQLKGLARGIYISVSPNVSQFGSIYNSLDILVQDIIPPFKRTKNPFLRYFRRIAYRRKVSNAPCERRRIYPLFYNTPGSILETVQGAKDTFLKSKQVKQ